MKNNRNQFVEHTLQVEGIYSNHPADPGGETVYGIARKRWPHWEGWKVVDECKDKDGKVIVLLLEEIVKPLVFDFYIDNFWHKVKGDKLPSGVDLLVVDIAVNQGAKTAIKLLQRAIGVEDDGLIGPVTLRNVELYTASNLVKNITARRLHRYMKLARKSIDHFGFGWANRALASMFLALEAIDSH